MCNGKKQDLTPIYAAYLTIVIFIVLISSCAYGPPIILGDSAGWRVAQVLRYESHQPYAIVKDGLEIAFSHLQTGNKTWLHVMVQFQIPMEEKASYAYRLSETWLRLDNGNLYRTNTFPCEELISIYNTHKGILANEAFELAMNRKFPELEAVHPAPAFKARRGCIVAFLKTPYPRNETPFIIHLGGLLKDGKPVYVPDVEFQFIP
jgi:hypothetical protein